MFYLSECLVSWLSKKKSSVSLSTAKAEYIAAAGCCTQVLWMKQTLTDIQVEYDDPIPIYCDNTSAISISRTRWCTPRWSTFQSSITFYGNMLQIRTSYLNMWSKITSGRNLYKTTSMGSLWVSSLETRSYFLLSPNVGPLPLNWGILD